MKIKFKEFLIAFGFTFGMAVVGSVATARNVVTWYPLLTKPSLNPPNWLFGPVWSLLYVMMALSLYLVLTARKNKYKKEAIKCYFWQMVLNALWSIVFFGLRSPQAALVEIIGMWLAIGLTIFYFYHVSKKAAYLLIPYLLWVSFASWLNYQIVILN